MGDSLVLELQQLARSGDTALTELLRHAKVVAVKLGLDDARIWIDHEIGGYPNGVELPSYRLIPSELRTRNPYHGWNAVAWESGGDLQVHFGTFHVGFALAEVVEIATKGEGEPRCTITQPEMDALLAANPDFGRLPTARCFSRASVIGIMEAVRAKILDWALELEKRGVLGRGMTFNESEKRGAAEVVFRAIEARVLVLVMSANPDAEEPLDVEKEHNRIVKARDGSRHQDRVELEAFPDLDLLALAKSLRLHKPVVVHVTGHGTEDGSIVIRDEEGQAFPMNPAGLAKMFALHKTTLRLVVLNACYSEKLAEILIGDIDFVVGMSRGVDDEAATLFSQTFYGSLFDGASISESFDTSVAVVHARYETEADIPVLRYKAGRDPATTRLID